MPNRFCCKNCGMITESPEIEVFDQPVNGIPSMCYKITCPTCLGITRFTRPKPFPTDKPTLGDLKIVNGVPYRYVKAGEDIIVSKSE